MKEAHIKHLPLRTTLGFAWSMVSQQKGMLALMAGSACAFSLIELALPVIGQHLFDALTPQAQASAELRDDIWRLTAVFLASASLFWVFRMLMFFVFIPFSANYMSRLVQSAFDKVQRFSTAWHNDTFSGVTVRNITRGMGALDGIMELVIPQFLPSFLFIFGTAFYLMATGKAAVGAGVLAFALLFMLISGTVSLRYVARLNQIANEEDSRLGGLVADSVTCNAAVKSFGMEGFESDRIRTGLAMWRARKSKAWYAATANGMMQTVLIVSARIALVLFAVDGWMDGRLTLGEVFYYFSIAAVMHAYLRDFGAQIRMMQTHINDLDPVAAYMRMTPGVTDAPNAPALAVDKGRIDFDGVTFGYKPDLPPLFETLSLSIVPGQTVALVGRSGSGKTSFVKMVQRLYDIQGGRILIDGQDIAQVSQDSLHRAIALVPQDPVLFHRTLAENIAYARPGADMDDIRAAARDAYLEEFIANLPDGYDTMVGERGVKLSGGERQRVAIARAILADRPILILDEATSALDSVSETIIQKALDNLMRGRTTLIIAHRLSTIRRADRILVFQQGQIVEEGRHEDLLAKNGVYKTLYDAQIDGLI